MELESRQSIGEKYEGKREEIKQCLSDLNKNTAILQGIYCAHNQEKKD